MPKPISDRLAKTLAYIQEFSIKNGQSPTIKEIAGHFRIEPPSAFAQVKRLEEAGYIRKLPGQWRSIQVIDIPPNETPQIKEFINVPIVGKVAAGTPILAEENKEGELLVDSTLTRKGGVLFALKVKGDSMINADIKHGDFVVVRQQPVADSGDIVVALVKNEGVIKRLKTRAGQIELVSENPRYRPLQVKRGDEFQIVGKVASIYRVPKS